MKTYAVIIVDISPGVGGVTLGKAGWCLGRRSENKSGGSWSSLDLRQGLRLSSWTRNGPARCQVCYLLETTLMRCDTYHHLDED